MTEESTEDDIEISYSITTEEIYNNILSCTTAYDFLDRVKEDVIAIKMDYQEFIETSMVQCVELVCHLISEVHSNIVPEEDGEE